MSNRPNILVLLCDQLRRQSLACYGDPNINTPNIDALAARGVRFDAACSTYPVCVPFRFTLMTGHYAHSRQVPAIEWRMSPAERTLADEFNEAGYETIYIGKWHLDGGHGPGCMKTPVPRDYQGRWQTWRGFELRNSFFDTCYFENGDPTPIPLAGYQTDGLVELTIESLRQRNRDMPFACVLSVEAPHGPREAPEDYEARWRNRDVQLPPNFLIAGDLDPDATGWSRPYTEEDRDRAVRDFRLYHAMVENLDWNVGRLLSFLEESGQAENTVVVFTSDHGDLLGSHAVHEKQYPFEESCGIPLIVTGLGEDIPAGKTITAPVSTEDLFPTLLGLAGITPRERLYGSDFAPVIRDGRQPPERPGVMLEFVRELRPNVVFHRRDYRGFRSARYKYTVWGREQGMQPWQFFDLEDDPYERVNLIGDPAYEAQIRQHHQWLRDRMVETGDTAWLAAFWAIDALNPWAVV